METASGSITVLTDNTVPERSDALAEHGFAALVETETCRILFDTGKGRTVVHNAAVLGADLAGVDRIVLSHAHGDHTGGLAEVLQVRRGTPTDVLAHPDVFAERFRVKDGARIFGGIPFRRGYLEKLGARFAFNREPVEVAAGVLLTGEVPRVTVFEGGDMGNRSIVRQGEVEPDLLLDDQSLVLRTAQGLVLLLGCAHAGMVNVLHHAIRATGVEEILAVVGGTHIGLSGEEQRERTIEALAGFRIRHLIPAHCTGLEAMARMRAALGERVRFSHVGLTFSF